MKTDVRPKELYTGLQHKPRVQSLGNMIIMNLIKSEGYFIVFHSLRNIPGYIHIQSQVVDAARREVNSHVFVARVNIVHPLWACGALTWGTNCTKRVCSRQSTQEGLYVTISQWWHSPAVTKVCSPELSVDLKIWNFIPVTFYRVNRK